MDIFITGCAKTRTTLIHWLFSAFKGCAIIPSESSVYVFRKNFLHYYNPKNIHLVAKRMYGSILCGTKLYYENYCDQVSRISTDNIQLVSIRRNREDTLKSENGYVPPERYDFWEEEVQALSNLIVVEIDADNLLINPNIEQEKVSKTLGLEIVDWWSTWPDFVMADQIKAFVDYPKFLNPIGE